MIDLAGQVVIVTGAAQGLGLATALGFAQHRAKVALVDINEATLNEAVRQVSEQGAECIPVLADITAPGAAAGIVRQTVDAFGRINVLVNNAGISSVEPLLEVTESE